MGEPIQLKKGKQVKTVYGLAQGGEELASGWAPATAADAGALRVAPPAPEPEPEPEAAKPAARKGK